MSADVGALGAAPDVDLDLATELFRKLLAACSRAPWHVGDHSADGVLIPP